MEAFTKEQKEAYLQTAEKGQPCCPYCGGPAFANEGDVDCIKGGIEISIWCDKCPKEWVEVYHLVSIKPLEAGKNSDD